VINKKQYINRIEFLIQNIGKANCGFGKKNLAEHSGSKRTGGYRIINEISFQLIYTQYFNNENQH